MHFLSLIRRCRQSGANRPDRLIGHDSLTKPLNASDLKDLAQLSTNNIQRPTRFALFKRFTQAQHRGQPTLEGRGEFASHLLVIFTKNQTPLGMTDQHPLATCVCQLRWRILASQCAVPHLTCTILRTDSDGSITQSFDYLRHMHTGGKHDHFDRLRNILLTQRGNQISDAGAGTVHLPVTSYQGATHDLPRRSKWAQMVLNEIPSGKRESRTCLLYDISQFFGITAHLLFVVPLDHHPHQRFGP